MIFSRFVKKQLYISAAILIAYGLYFLITYERYSNKAAMIGGEDAMNLSSQAQGLTWEILVVDPKLRELLWEKYRQASLEEKEKAFIAIIHMMDSISEEQAKHLAEQLVQKSANSTKREHRLKLFELFERMARKFELVRSVLSHFAASKLQDQQAPVTKKIEINNMMNNISKTIKDTPYKYCMQGSNEKVKACSLQLAQEHSDRANQYLHHYMNEKNPQEAKRLALSAFTKVKNAAVVEYVEGLINSPLEEDIVTGLEIIRSFRVKKLKAELHNLRSRTMSENLRSELELTIKLIEDS